MLEVLKEKIFTDMDVACSLLQKAPVWNIMVASRHLDVRTTTGMEGVEVTEQGIIGIGVGPQGSTDYYMDGVPVDQDNRPAASECYPARRFGDPERTPPPAFASANITGDPIEGSQDSTEMVIDRIDHGLPVLED
jgi:hypothetical protein